MPWKGPGGNRKGRERSPASWPSSGGRTAENRPSPTAPGGPGSRPPLRGGGRGNGFPQDDGTGRRPAGARRQQGGPDGGGGGGRKTEGTDGGRGGRPGICRPGHKGARGGGGR